MRRAECPETGGKHVWTDDVPFPYDRQPGWMHIHCDECGKSAPPWMVTAAMLEYERRTGRPL